MNKSYYIRALDDYSKARRKADLEELLGRISGSSQGNTLLSYDEVRQKLGAIEKSHQRLEEIPLDGIIGSVGRYHDFTRKFLPKSSISPNRWARVMASSQELTGLPPIEVYQIGEAYFVKDGNHRVSVARQMGSPTIQAYVTELESKVPLTPDTTPDELIIKSEQVHFLEETQLDRTRPGSDLSATKAGAYPTLLEHIAVHRYYMGLEQKREIPFTEAAAHWYDTVFLPVVKLIEKRGLLKDLPNRTAADLYLWAADHKAGIEKNLGWNIGTEVALSDLTENIEKENKPLLNWIRNLIQLLLPNNLESGPPPGTWRERLFSRTVLKHLFNDIVIALDGSENAKYALDLAIQLAQQEDSHLHGIHTLSEALPEEPQENLAQQEAFADRCRSAGLSEFNFIATAGEIDKILSERCKFVDLVVLPLNHPPGDNPLDRLSSGLFTIIRNCSVPILTVPASSPGFGSLLLAYDGSVKSQEALFVAAYFASQHRSSITILTSSDGLPDALIIQEQARDYLSTFPINTRFLIRSEPVAEAINALLKNQNFQLVIIGGYGGSLLRDVVLGSAVDAVLREVKLPILICR